MTPPIRTLLFAATSLALGGCWQAGHSLYGKVKTITPFREGLMTETGGKDPAQNFDVTLNRDGVYRMIGRDKGTDDYGEGFQLSFFQIAGLPENFYAYEAVSLTKCAKPSGCDPVKPDEPRYYGLIRTNIGGADEIRPDCKEDFGHHLPIGCASGQ